MTELIRALSLFADQWLGTALPKLFLLFLGILLCVLVVAAIWDRRIKALSASIVISVGFFLVAVALWESVATALGGMDVSSRIRLIAVIASACTLALTAFAFARMGLHPRYGLLWTAISLLVLLTALFPKPLQIFPSILGVHFAPALASLSIFFLLLLVFHFSVVISELRDRQSNLLDRIHTLEQKMFGSTEPADGDHATILQQNFFASLLKRIPIREMWRSFSWKTQHGTSLTAPAIILLTMIGVVATGMLAPQVMIGDEVTHYFMMRTQVETFPAPNFFAQIPTGWGDIEIRRYPHSFFWHYLGGLIFLLTGGSFFFTQLYQAFFLGQLLLVAYLLARSRRGVETRSALVYLLLVASLPMTLIFSVAFYQDVPMTAQILTSFYFLKKGRWLQASLFLCLALGFKVTAILFFPIFFLCLFVWTYRQGSWKRTALVVTCSLLLTGSFTYGFGKIIERYSHIPFYPVTKAEQILRQLANIVDIKQNSSSTEHIKTENQAVAKDVEAKQGVREQVGQIIANHPGDLRIKANFLIYGGVLLYLAFGGAAAAACYQAFGLGRNLLPTESSIWLWGTGLSYIIFTTWFLKEAPDARFFLPGLVFCLLPVAERLVCFPKPRWVVMLLTVLALMQAGYALAKTYKLRVVVPEIQEAIDYLGTHPPHPRSIFMYPEGNYRLFPVPHEWYLRYYLRDFWRSDNTKRLAILNRYKIGAVVVKKHLVASVDKEITNLGVYPNYFVRDLKNDSRFKKVFENREVAIYTVPPPDNESPEGTAPQPAD